MKFKRYSLLPLATLGILLVSGPGFGQTANRENQEHRESQEQTVQLSQVPQAARKAAEKALGTTATEAKVIVGTSPQEYELTAMNKSGKEQSVHVLADGTVLKKEKSHEAKARTDTERR